MPDRRRHRGRHPADVDLFDREIHPTLVTAVSELSWLLGRGYSETSALKIVGDRHGLRERQRMAVRRCACGEDARADRASRRVAIHALAGRELAIDGFNCLITIEAALSGGVVLVGRDRSHRDLASVHGSYRRVEETSTAVAAVGAVLASSQVAGVRWYLDRPVSNSGRLRQLISEQAERAGWSWTIELVNSPDRELVAVSERVVASSDSWVLDRCKVWVDLPAAVTAAQIPEAWIVDLSGCDYQN